MIRVTFSREKETTNTVRYKEDTSPPIVGTIYLNKKQVEQLGNPDHILVVVEAVQP